METGCMLTRWGEREKERERDEGGSERIKYVMLRDRSYNDS